MTIRVVVVDDQAMVRAGFTAVLAAQTGIDVVGEAANGREALQVCRELRPDVVLMDVRMPEMDGLDAVRHLMSPSAEDTHRPRVLMLTTYDVDAYVYEALRSGASGFLLKDAPITDLTRAVRVIAEGDALLSPSVTRRLIADFAAARPTPRQDTGDGTRLRLLTPRETEILELVARGHSNTQIAQHLVVAEQTVKTHIGNIFAKLTLRDRAQAVIFAYESGLITPGTP
ncbi:response regulator transcription factor [Streptomyces sp. NPDC051976]|uniref:response regulator transcription factor n=1 Tax=Streptomyces sp. NPDC051976 TaxID=3154947 RepID=UPI0034142735